MQKLFLLFSEAFMALLYLLYSCFIGSKVQVYKCICLHTTKQDPVLCWFRMKFLLKKCSGKLRDCVLVIFVQVRTTYHFQMSTMYAVVIGSLEISPYRFTPGYSWSASSFFSWVSTLLLNISKYYPQSSTLSGFCRKVLLTCYNYRFVFVVSWIAVPLSYSF